MIRRSPRAPLTRSVERFVVPWTRLDWPVEWSRSFGREAMLSVELGFGNGEYLRERAGSDPARDWVGVEVSWNSVVRLLRRIEEDGLGNVRIAQGDGAFLLRRLFAPGILEEIVINHPDPWPKKRHHGRRLIQPSFLHLAASRLAAGGRLTVVTDHADYADWIEGVFLAQNALESEFPTPRAPGIPGRHPTKYERKGLEAGSRIHYFVWRKARETAPAPPEEEPLEPMPNVILSGMSEVTDPLRGFSPWTWEGEHRDTPVHVSFLAAFERLPEGEWLVEALVKEGGFTQHLALALSPREGGRLVVHPAPMGYPRPTWGVKQAVARLAEWLLAHRPGLGVEGSTVGPLRPPPAPLP